MNVWINNLLVNAWTSNVWLNEWLDACVKQWMYALKHEGRNEWPLIDWSYTDELIH